MASRRKGSNAIGVGRTLRLEYPDGGQSPASTPQSAERALNASGLRATARVLPGRLTTKKGSGPPAGAAGGGKAPPAQAGRGGAMVGGDAGGAAWAQRRACRDGELRPAPRPSTLVRARSCSTPRQGVSLGGRMGASPRLWRTPSVVGALWPHALFPRRVGGLRTAARGSSGWSAGRSVLPRPNPCTPW